MPIPTDNVKVAEVAVTDEEWTHSTTAHQRFKELVEATPRAKARYDAALAEIESR